MSSPVALDAALAALAAPGAKPVAGGTDMLVPGSACAAAGAPVVDLTRVAELRGIELRGGLLDIGAGETFAALRHDPLVAKHAPILAEVAATVGALQIQARASLGGNVANASPAGDSLPVLLALDASFELASPGGRRVVPASEMFVGYRKTALRPGEVIVRLAIPVRAADGVQRFVKVGTRAAQAISKVSVALACHLRDGQLREVRFAAGSVAAVPVRLLAAEQACEGRAPDAALGEAAARAAVGEVQPIDDVRSTAAYRRVVLGRVVRRLILQLSSPEVPSS